MAHEGPATRLRRGAVALATALLAVGCGDGHGGDDAAAGPSPEHTSAHGKSGGGSGGPETDAPSDGSPKPLGPAPRTRRKALPFARKVVAKPATWGGGFVRDRAYKSGPDATAELDEDCVWKQRDLRSSEVVSITRRSVLPAEDGKDALHVAAVVTVYRDEMSAKWDMAGTLEEVMRCPDQKLNAREQVTGLVSSGGSPALLGGGPDRDFVLETGGVDGDGPGGPYFYYWGRSRFGAVVVSVVGKGAEGRDKDEVNAVMATGQAYMWKRVESELGVAE